MSVQEFIYLLESVVSSIAWFILGAVTMYAAMELRHHGGHRR